eukprot:14016347-Alexandrium_andersonii.AAC.1
MEAQGAGGKGRGQPPEFHLRPAAAACLDPELGATSVAYRRMARLERQLRALAKRTLRCERSGFAADDLRHLRAAWKSAVAQARL